MFLVNIIHPFEYRGEFTIFVQLGQIISKGHFSLCFLYITIFKLLQVVGRGVSFTIWDSVMIKKVRVLYEFLCL